ncbi:uncharacterized protein [Onthophagus taurus]|uniref:uncharacterized protein isoform X2 n=1 Tax=Onthophagus taurus TaxID=166361 RepID=UPI000C203F22|nr:uncharacterized protein LOC111427608 isoform X2 [Onthophagus taurus]
MARWKIWMKNHLLLAFTVITMVPKLCYTLNENKISFVDRELFKYVDEIFDEDRYKIFPGLEIENNTVSKPTDRCLFNKNKNTINETHCEESRSMGTLEDYFYKKLYQYTQNHVVAVNVSETSRFFKAFALKKLLLPVIIGAQIFKSILIAMFLPSILGSLGKLLGKGLSSFSGISGSSAGLGHHADSQTIDDFEFKDTGPYNNDLSPDYTVNNDNTITLNTGSSTEATAMNRFGIETNRISYVQNPSDNYYFKKPQKKTDFKVFHKIPPSSLLLTSYDPFYSPLLSRLDSVFQQLGLGDSKILNVEKCRERLVCLMYANPAKYAPYSNLVSAQLSRELNELKKPTSDNSEILRFFKYMKAAKDGQDNENCKEYKGCPQLSGELASPAMLTTFNDINKLVQARKLTS